MLASDVPTSRGATFDAAAVLGALTLYIGGDDHRIARLRSMLQG